MDRHFYEFIIDRPTDGLVNKPGITQRNLCAREELV